MNVEKLTPFTGTYAGLRRNYPVIVVVVGNVGLTLIRLFPWLSSQGILRRSRKGVGEKSHPRHSSHILCSLPTQINYFTFLSWWEGLGDLQAPLLSCACFITATYQRRGTCQCHLLRCVGIFPTCIWKLLPKCDDEYSAGLIERQAMTTKKCERREELFGSAIQAATLPERARKTFIVDGPWYGHIIVTFRRKVCKLPNNNNKSHQNVTGNWRNPWNLPNNFFRQIYWVSRTTFYKSSVHSLTHLVVWQWNFSYLYLKVEDIFASNF